MFDLSAQPARRSRPVANPVLILVTAAAGYVAAIAVAQTPPEIGYIFPPAGAVGSAMEVKVGGYNWTPDMQIFVHDPNVKLEVAGPPSSVIVPEPPYWFGKKARDNDLPLPREFPARLTIGPDAKPGLVRWQAANANGATASGVFLVTSDKSDQLPNQTSTQPVLLDSVPTTISGRVLKLEEVHRYAFRAPRNGPISLDLRTRQFGTKMNAILEVRDQTGELIADGADTAGHDLQLTFVARANELYTISLYDADFRGHHSFVYRLLVHDGPRVVAAIPSAGKRGDRQPVQFLVAGLSPDPAALETVSAEVEFPSEPGLPTFAYELATGSGKSIPFHFPLSDFPELKEEVVTAPRSELPFSVTGCLEKPRGADSFSIMGKAGDAWSVCCESAKAGVPLDVGVVISDANGKELSRADDMPGSTNSRFQFSVPADGTYHLAVSDHSGQSGCRDAVYRLSVLPTSIDFQMDVPENFSLPLGGTSKLTVKVQRQGKAEPVAIELIGLPAGVVVSTPGPLVIAPDKNELAIELKCAEDIAASPARIKVRGTCKLPEREVVRTSNPSLMAVTMKPRVKITPEGLDDVRKWPRGSTYLAPVLIERLEGFTGEIVLEQTAHQQRVRQGIQGPDFVVAPGETRVEYPVFLPEWLETTKTSRIILNGVTKVRDPQGVERYLLNKMELRIGMLPVGALLKIAPERDDVQVKGAQPFELPVHLTRATELVEPAIVEVVFSKEQSEKFSAKPVTVTRESPAASIRIEPIGEVFPPGESQFNLRATVLRQGKWPVVSETSFVVEFSQ